jgi:hypothetical protein
MQPSYSADADGLISVTPRSRFMKNDKVSFTLAYSHERNGTIVRRFWAGGWCYDVREDEPVGGLWQLTESSLTLTLRP